mgnify:CR=1 FL=1
MLKIIFNKLLISDIGSNVTLKSYITTVCKSECKSSGTNIRSSIIKEKWFYVTNILRFKSGHLAWKKKWL